MRMSWGALAYFVSFASENSKFFLENPRSDVKIQKGNTQDSGKRKEEVGVGSNPCEIYQSVLHNKGLFSRGKYTTRSLSHPGEGHSLTLSPSSLTVVRGLRGIEVKKQLWTRSMDTG